MNLLLYNEALKKISLARENIKTKQNKTESEILTEKKKKNRKEAGEARGVQSLGNLLWHLSDNKFC